jgi:F0F1-type ATP synthase alpha subunit
MHFRKMFDEKYIGAWDLEETPEVTVTIKEVKREELKANAGAEVAHKPVIYFEKTEKGMVCNKTNANVIAAAYGSDVSKWKGRKVTIYVEQVRAFGALHNALRLRIPEGK